MNTGIDISRWQKGLNLATAKKEGFTHVIIKAGGADSGLYKDSMFESFYNQARAAQMTIVGAYFYGQAFSVADAQREARYFISLLQGKSFPCVFYDVEGKMLNQGYSHLTEVVKAFIDTVQASGYPCGIYTSESHFNNKFDDKQLSKYTHWVARYSKTKPTLKSGNSVNIWQYGGEVNYLHSNKIGGITTDQNYFYKTFSQESIINIDPNIQTKSTYELAQEVLAGKYGNGVDRKNNLGYRYEEVQAEVERILKEQLQPTEKSIDQLAVEVLAGLWGNGIERIARLGSKYSAVQKRVNEIIASRKEENKIYVVQKGDTLSSIARKYKTTYQRLAQINGIKNPNKIYVGQQIKLA